jgi:hypothetical protein
MHPAFVVPLVKTGVQIFHFTDFPDFQFSAAPFP